MMRSLHRYSNPLQEIFCGANIDLAKTTGATKDARKVLLPWGN